MLMYKAVKRDALDPHVFYSAQDGTEWRLHERNVISPAEAVALGACGFHACAVLAAPFLVCRKMYEFPRDALLQVRMEGAMVTDGVTTAAEMCTAVGIVSPEEVTAALMSSCELIYEGGRCTERYTRGRLHSEDDGSPAVVTRTCRMWYKDGVLHRENDLPAVVFHDGAVQEWYWNGVRHRSGNQPAVVQNLGTRWQDADHHRGVRKYYYHHGRFSYFTTD